MLYHHLHSVQLVNDRAAESQQERSGTKRPAGPTSEDEEEEEEEEEEEPKRAPPGKRLRQVHNALVPCSVCSGVISMYYMQ